MDSRGRGGRRIGRPDLRQQDRLTNSLRDLFFEQTDLRKDDRVLNQKFGGTSTLNILISTPAPDGLKDPNIMRAIEGLQTRLKENPAVGRTESYVDYVKRMRRTFYQDDPRSEQVPDSPEEAAQFLFLYSVSGNPDDFKRLADVGYQNAVILTFLKSDATELAEQLIRTIDEYKAAHFPRCDGRDRGKRPGHLGPQRCDHPRQAFERGADDRDYLYPLLGDLPFVLGRGGCDDSSPLCRPL